MGSPCRKGGHKPLGASPSLASSSSAHEWETLLKGRKRRKRNVAFRISRMGAFLPGMPDQYLKSSLNIEMLSHQETFPLSTLFLLSWNGLYFLVLWAIAPVLVVYSKIDLTWHCRIKRRMATFACALYSTSHVAHLNVPWNPIGSLPLYICIRVMGIEVYTPFLTSRQGKGSCCWAVLTR